MYLIGMATRKGETKENHIIPLLLIRCNLSQL
ncbi:MAG: hypothetical protein ACI976_001470 [Aureispira sp.]|jgi:hypothetical protein